MDFNTELTHLGSGASICSCQQQGALVKIKEFGKYLNDLKNTKKCLDMPSIHRLKLKRPSKLKLEQEGLTNPKGQHSNR